MRGRRRPGTPLALVDTQKSSVSQTTAAEQRADYTTFPVGGNDYFPLLGN